MRKRIAAAFIAVTALAGMGAVTAAVTGGSVALAPATHHVE